MNISSPPHLLSPAPPPPTPLQVVFIFIDQNLERAFEGKLDEVLVWWSLVELFPYGRGHTESVDCEIYLYTVSDYLVSRPRYSASVNRFRAS